MTKITYEVTDLNLESGAGEFSEFTKLLKKIDGNAITLQQMIHKACVLANLEWFKEKNPNWISTLIRTLNPLGGSVRVQAVILWFELFGGVTITVERDGKVGVTKNKKWKGERDADKLNEAKASPFYKIAPPEKTLTMPEVSFTAVGAMMARRTFLGEEPNFDEYLDMMKKAYQAALSSKGFKTWKDKAAVALSEGELEMIRVPKSETEIQTEVEAA